MSFHSFRISDWLSGLALTVLGALGLGIPLAIAIIWICS
jgi:hypothetical protein